MSMFSPEGGFDMSALLQQAQALQEQFASAQSDLESATVTGTAGGDLVTVTMSGTMEVKDLRIAPSAVDPDDFETLQDLILAAIRDAQGKASALAQETLPNTSSLGF